MRQLLFDIDRLLRGGFTRPADLRIGKIAIPVRSLLIAGTALGWLYGLFMGIYGATRPENAAYMQLFATTLKVPLLFLLTLLVTLPSLYVLSALAGSRLHFRETLRLLLAAVGINLALLASLGPVVGFFTLSTQSYPFMVVLNVVCFAVSGAAGLVFLRRALQHVFAGPPEPPRPIAAAVPAVARSDEDGDAGEPEPQLDAGAAVQKLITAPLARRTESDPGKNLFRGWLVVYGVIGCQMGWVLRPFIGAPSLEFALFRSRESNFFEALLGAIGQLLT